MLKPNSTFPKLELPTVTNEDWDLNQSKAETFKMLVFYRGYHCPVCKKYNQQIERKLNDFADKGVDVIAISCDSEDRARKTKAEWGLENLKIAYDLPIEQAESLGLYISEAISDNEPEQFSEPALFLLKPDNSIYAAYYQSMPFGRPPVDELLKGLDFIIDKNYPPRGTVKSESVTV
ncbi:AhpC/TSA family protein [Fulvivirga sp. RKSG066]|uniref:peroxiredoxin-like family protein n=1 Tax=Fulvivirga aurantia TaxID=2529383 RepID=UPI0012BBA3F6|nr:peroxiredoxin-like family protein [Fulvivirga aurantia]MTI20956.1 AhpC/TSA family protein [Fulvivirga aurantia]